MKDQPTTERVHPRSERLDGAPLPQFLSAMLDDHTSVIDAVRRALPEIAALAGDIAQCYSAGGTIVFAGAGTSGRLGALEAAECPPTFGTDPQRIRGIMAGGPAAFHRSIEGAEDDFAAGGTAIDELGIGSGDLVIGISASGSTPFVHGALSTATRHGATTAAIVCNHDSPISTLAERAIVLETGAEFVAGSTRLKAGSAQKLALNLITTGAMVQLGRVRAGRMIAVQASNAKLRARAALMIEELLGVDQHRAVELLDEAGGDLFAVLGHLPPQPLQQPTDPPDVTFRTLGPSDAHALARLSSIPAIVTATAPFARLGGEALFRAWLERPGFMLGAFHQDVLVGVALVESHRALLREHVADVTYVAVDPEYSRSGLGEQLMHRVLDWAASTGHTRVELRVWPDNDPALRLYSRLGFVVEGRLRAHAIVEGRVYDAIAMAWIDPRLDAAREERKEERQ